eukprot:55340_1
MSSSKLFWTTIVAVLFLSGFVFSAEENKEDGSQSVERVNAVKKQLGKQIFRKSDMKLIAAIDGFVRQIDARNRVPNDVMGLIKKFSCDTKLFCAFSRSEMRRGSFE